MARDTGLNSHAERAWLRGAHRPAVKSSVRLRGRQFARDKSKMVSHLADSKESVTFEPKDTEELGSFLQNQQRQVP